MSRIGWLFFLLLWFFVVVRTLELDAQDEDLGGK
jgi:hypothetical protein